MMLNKKWLAACAVIATLTQPSTVAAGSISGQIGVEMVIQPSCRVTSSTTVDEAGARQWGTLSFGSHNDLTSDKSARSVDAAGNGTFRFQCSDGLTAVMTVDGGLNGDGTLRYMANTNEPLKRLAYRLYLDSGFHMPVVAGEPQAMTQPDGTPSGSFALFGRVLSSEQPHVMPAAGTYTDTLLVTLSW